MNIPNKISNYFCLAFLLLTMAACANKQIMKENMFFNNSIYEPVDFIEHSANKPMGSWLGRQLPYPPFDELRKELESKLGYMLSNRGEAHITVITPVEYDQFLRKYISIQKINEIAVAQNIQKTKFDPICIGQSELNTNGKDILKTFYVVIKSPELVEIRKKISEEYLKLGGDSRKFDPEYWFPHITLGFTKRDLHLEDGVYKDINSCYYPLIQKSDK